MGRELSPVSVRYALHQLLPAPRRVVAVPLDRIGGAAGGGAPPHACRPLRLGRPRDGEGGVLVEATAPIEGERYLTEIDGVAVKIASCADKRTITAVIEALRRRPRPKGVNATRLSGLALARV